MTGTVHPHSPASSGPLAVPVTDHGPSPPGCYSSAGATRTGAFRPGVQRFTNWATGWTPRTQNIRNVSECFRGMRGWKAGLTCVSSHISSRPVEPTPGTHTDQHHIQQCERKKWIIMKDIALHILALAGKLYTINHLIHKIGRDGVLATVCPNMKCTCRKHVIY